MSHIRHRIEIHYCPKCRWLLRSAWYAQEILETFGDKIEEVALKPDHDTAGRFCIRVADAPVWDRKTDGGFPEIKLLKQRVRDLVDPEKDLGHSDKTG